MGMLKEVCESEKNRLPPWQGGTPLAVRWAEVARPAGHKSPAANRPLLIECLTKINRRKDYVTYNVF